MDKFCKHCGQDLKENADICLSCGKLIKEVKEFKNTMTIIGLILVVASAFFVIVLFFAFDDLIRDGLYFAHTQDEFIAAVIGYAIGIVIIQIALAIPALILSIINQAQKPNKFSLTIIILSSLILITSVIQAIVAATRIFGAA